MNFPPECVIGPYEHNPVGPEVQFAKEASLQSSDVNVANRRPFLLRTSIKVLVSRGFCESEKALSSLDIPPLARSILPVKQEVVAFQSLYFKRTDN